MKARQAAGGRPRPASPWRWAVAGGVVGALIIVTLAAPARWLAAGVALASHDAVLLHDAQGTVWSGSARLAFSGGSDSRDLTELPRRIGWQLRPTLGGLRARVSAACCTPNGPIALHLRPRWGGMQVRIHDNESVWPTAILAGLGTPWNTIQPEGSMTVRTSQLGADWSAGRLALDGQVHVTLQDMSSRLSTLQPMGSYRINITGGDTVRIELATIDGALTLSGHGQWVGQRLHFSGEARAAPGMEAQLANLLNVIGRRQGDRAIISLG